MNGYAGKILRIDLTNKPITIEDLSSESNLGSYIGWLGLGLRIIYDDLLSGFNVMDPQTPMLFMAGPLTGIRIPWSNSTSLDTKHLGINFTLCRSHSHGFFGPNLEIARGIINQSYFLAGWDEKSGKPWRSTLKKLGMEDIIGSIRNL
jgi:aldehyde:ferredoxin oxidoreductase